MGSMRSTRTRVGSYTVRDSGGALLVIVATMLIASAASCASAPSGTPGHIEGSRVKTYNSIQQLSRDSALIVVALATGSHAEGADQGIPYTTTTVNVQNVLKGAAGSTLKVRQLGNSTTVTGGEFDPLLVAGQSYVLFLNAFTYGPGQETGEYVVVGGSAGLYTLAGQTLHHAHGPDQIPDTLSITDLEQAIAT